MIVAGLDNMRRKFPSLQALLPSEYQWVFHFLFSYVFPKLLGQGTIRRIKQVSPILTQLSLHSCPNVSQSPLYKGPIVTQLSRNSCANVAQSVSHEFIFFKLLFVPDQHGRRQANLRAHQNFDTRLKFPMECETQLVSVSFGDA
jgi:hypothetical protein